MACWPFDGRVALAVCVTAAMLAPTGCGDAEDDDREIRAVFVDVQRQFAARDAAGMCELVSSSAWREVGAMGHGRPSSCSRDVRRLFEWIRAPRRRSRMPRVIDVETSGSQATVTAALDGGAPGTVPFVKEEGKWRLDNFFGVVAPPRADLR